MKLPEINDYLNSISDNRCIKASKLQGGQPEMNSKGKIKRYAGGFCVVFPYQTPQGKYAVRCWHTKLNNMLERTEIISDALDKLCLPYFVQFEYIPEGLLAGSNGVQPIVLMEWIDALPLKKYIAKHLHEPQKLSVLADKFMDMVVELHNHNLSHGDLQHGNIMVKENGDILLVDYDSMFVPGLESFSDDIKGLPGYQHPSRVDNEKCNSKSDYFSELIIYLSIKSLEKDSSLWDSLYIADTEVMLFKADDYKEIERNEVFQYLYRFDDLRPLLDALSEMLQQSDINDLQKLEDILLGCNAEQNILENVSNKWRSAPKPIQKNKIDKDAIAQKISSRWKQ